MTNGIGASIFYGGSIAISQKMYSGQNILGEVWHGIYYILNYLCAQFDNCIQFGNTLVIFEDLPTPL